MRLIIFSLFLSLHLFAFEQCEKLATGMLGHLGSDKTIVSKELIISELGDTTYGCVVGFSGGGYAVISSSISSSPIRSYSFEGSFDNLPPDVKNMIKNDLKALKNSETDTIHPSRQYLLDFDNRLSLQTLDYSYTTKTLPLNSQWNQDGFYQKYMPKDVNGDSTLAGCVNIALGQIMRYHQHPTRGSDIVSHTWGNKTYEAILNRKYNWTNMPKSLDSSNEDYEIDEVAMLLYDLGIANKTEFGVNGSGTHFKPSILYKNFGYTKNIDMITSVDKEAFFQTIKDEITALRPMYLSIPATSEGSSGHAVVVDNFQDDEIGRFMHLNFGWGGAYDGFINIDSPKEVQNLDLASNNLELYHNIKPCDSSLGDCYNGDDLEDTDSKSISTDNSTYSINGNLETLDDEDSFKIYAKGNTTFTLESDYYPSPDFYVNIYDYRNNLIYASNESFSIDLDTNMYSITVSKTNHDTGYYYGNETEGTHNYIVTTTTGIITNSEIDSINSSLQKAPKFFGNLDYEVLKIGDNKKFLVNASTANDNSQLFTINSDNSIINTTVDDNIITVDALKKGYTNLTVKAFSNSKESNKTIPLLVLDGNTTVGKDALLKSKFTSTNKDIISFNVLLDGQCEITGDRGFSSVSGFYIGVDANPTISADSYTDTFTQGIYTINASRYDFSNNTYSNLESTDGNIMDDFSIDLNCDSVETSASYLANAFGIFDYSTSKESSIGINSNWSLVSLPSDDKISITKFMQDYPQVNSIWMYKDNQWMAYSSDNDTFEKLKNSNIPIISYIEPNDGFWIDSSSSFTLTRYGDSFKTDFSSLYSGWDLISVKQDILPSELLENNSNINIIWKYNTSNTWEAYGDDTLNQDIEQKFSLIQTLNQGDGVWIYKK
ncbi:MAG: C10 family peptidase [Campylobacterota bacterium]